MSKKTNNEGLICFWLMFKSPINNEPYMSVLAEDETAALKMAGRKKQSVKQVWDVYNHKHWDVSRGTINNQ